MHIIIDGCGGERRRQRVEIAIADHFVKRNRRKEVRYSQTNQQNKVYVI